MQGGHLTSRLLRAVLAGTIGASFQFGFSSGFVNNTSVFIRDYFRATGIDASDDQAHFNFLWSIAVSAFAVGGMFGTFFFPSVANNIGRKKAVLCTTGFCYVACYCIAFPTSWMMLIVGRLLVGIGAGGACAAVPMYVSEISPIEIRGMMGTVHQLLITIGIAIAMALSTSKLNLLGSDELWQYMMLVPLVCTTFLAIVLPGCADSPSYLYRSQGREAAAEALRWFRQGCDEATITKELDAIDQELKLGGKTATIMDIYRDVALLKPVLVGCGVNLSMQMSGIDGVLYYSTSVFMEAGIPLEWAQVATTIVGVVNVLVTIPAMLFMDKAGRKVIQIAGLSGMCLSYIIMTFALVNGLHMLSVVAMVCVIVCFAFGPGCIAWFIIAELIPIHARGIATSLGLGINWVANWAVGFVFPMLMARMGSWTFSVFAISTGVLSLFTLECLPETKGKTVAEVAEFFAGAESKRKPLLIQTESK